MIKFDKDFADLFVRDYVENNLSKTNLNLDSLIIGWAIGKGLSVDEAEQFKYYVKSYVSLDFTNYWSILLKN